MATLPTFPLLCARLRFPAHGLTNDGLPRVKDWWLPSTRILPWKRRRPGRDSSRYGLIASRFAAAKAGLGVSRFETRRPGRSKLCFSRTGGFIPRSGLGWTESYQDLKHISSIDLGLWELLQVGQTKSAKPLCHKQPQENPTSLRRSKAFCPPKPRVASQSCGAGKLTAHYPRCCCQSLSSISLQHDDLSKPVAIG